MARQSYPSIPREPPRWRLPSLLAIQDLESVVEFLRVFAPAWNAQVDYTRRVATVLRNVLNGKTNNVGDITLTTSSTTTTLTDPLIGPNSHISFTPLTATASVVLYDGAFYVSARGKGTATLTHTSDANVNLDLTYTVTG